jgi:hypothetical protein|tara:strand:+ start:210 stop:401 length:192 start_codon:yes stop_codon:yes gene_type:complete
MITSNYNDFPTVPKVLLEAMQERFPQQDFNPSTSLRELDYHYGQRAVIKFLEAVFKEQNDNIL